MAIVKGDPFSCEISFKACCRRLNSFSLSVVNCDVAVVLVVVVVVTNDEDEFVDVVITTGGLFSISIFTLSIGSCFNSALAIVFASVDDVEDDVDGGFPSNKIDQ